jgi:hypothetical protein
MTDMISSTDGEEKFRIPYPIPEIITPTNKLEIPDSGYLRSPETVCPKTPLHIREMTSKETIQTVKEDIALLQEKLKKLEEIEKHKSPCEEAYKRVYGFYPETYEDSWSSFQDGYIASQKDYKVGEYQPTSQTPEQVEQGLRDAMKKAKEDGVFDEPKPKTLHDVIYKLNYDTSDSTCDVLVDMIEEWLPDEFDPNDSVYEYEIGWNEAIQSIKEKLR